METHLEAWVRMVNQCGAELGVTLVLGSLRVSGWLTPHHRLRAWIAEVTGRAEWDREGTFTIPTVPLGLIPDTLAHLVEEAWPELQARLQLQEGTPGVFREVALRDALLQGDRLSTTFHPMVTVSMEAVDVACLGLAPEYDALLSRETRATP